MGDEESSDDEEEDVRTPAGTVDTVGQWGGGTVGEYGRRRLGGVRWIRSARR